MMEESDEDQDSLKVIILFSREAQLLVSIKYRWQGSHSTWKCDSTARKPEKILEFCNLKQKSWESGMNPRTKGRLPICWFLSEQCSNVVASKLLKWVRKGDVT